MQAEIGRYARVNGVPVASAIFSNKLGRKVSKSTVNVMKKAYLEKKRRTGSGTVTTLSLKKRGRPILLEAHIDKQIQFYLKKIREHGGVITASVVVAAAHGILMARDKSLLAEFGGYITLSRHWAYHLLNYMNFVRRKAMTPKSKYKPADFAAVKDNDVVSIATMEEIPPELILNWDQTGIHLYLSENPQIVVNWFRHAGISAALDLDDSYESDQEEGEVDEVEEADVLSNEAEFDIDDETMIISSDGDSD